MNKYILALAMAAFAACGNAGVWDMAHLKEDLYRAYLLNPERKDFKDAYFENRVLNYADYYYLEALLRQSRL